MSQKLEQGLFANNNVFCFIFPTLNKFLWMFYKNPVSLNE